MNGGSLNNCIVYFNAAPTFANYTLGTSLDYSCTTPLPADGTGNLDADPQLASTTHVSSRSRCIGMGSAAYSRGTDWSHRARAAVMNLGPERRLILVQAMGRPVAGTLQARWLGSGGLMYHTNSIVIP